MSANLILAVMNLTLKTDEDCTVSWKEVIVMNHPSKGFFQYWIEIVSVKKSGSKISLGISEIPTNFLPSFEWTSQRSAATQTA